MKKIKPKLREDIVCHKARKNTSFIDPTPIAPIAANDSSSKDFSNFSPNLFVKSKTAHNKMLMRRRKRSQHPLRDLRLKRGFTLEELAELTTLSPSYLSRLESGSRRLNADILQRIATILGCHPGDLLPTELSTFKLSPSSWSLEEGREGSALANSLYIKDLPFHVLVPHDAHPHSFQLSKDGNLEWVTRPPQLYGVGGAFAFRVAKPCCGNRYHINDHIFANPSSPLTPGCYVLILTHQNQAFIGQFHAWEVVNQSETPDALTLSVMVDNESLPTFTQITLKKSDIKTSYRLVGTIEAA